MRTDLPVLLTALLAVGAVGGALAQAASPDAPPVEAAPAPQEVASAGALVLQLVPPAAMGEPTLARVLHRTAGPPPQETVALERAVRSIEGSRRADVIPGGPAALVVVWDRPGSGLEVVVLAAPAGQPPRALVAVPARGFDQVDATGDGKPDLVIHETKGRALAAAPVVYAWNGSGLAPTRDGTDAYYAEQEKALRARADMPAPPGVEPDAHLSEQLIALLDLGLLHETLGRRTPAFETYRALLARAKVPTRVSRDEAAARGAHLEIAREARVALARLIGIRVLTEPRASPSPSPSPSSSPSPSPSAPR